MNKASKIAVVRLDDLNDHILGAGLLTALRNAYPAARIVQVAPTGLKDFYARCPVIDDLVLVPEREQYIQDATRMSGLLRELATRERFELVINPRHAEDWHLAAPMCSVLTLPGGRTIGFRQVSAPYPGYDADRFYTRLLDVPAGRHAAHHIDVVLEHLGIPVPPGPPEWLSPGNSPLQTTVQTGSPADAEPLTFPAEGMKPDLGQVTICAADSVTPALAARALELSCRHLSFGDAILFTDADCRGSAFRTVRIPPLKSVADYSRFMLKDIARHIHTPYVLIVQWDGYVVEPRAWNPEFLQYDYIGAKWPFVADGMRVGNGGFCLRSRRLMEATSSPSFPFHPDCNEDWLICRTNRPQLERDFGIRFAPEEMADRFSYELATPDNPTFGFHALFNMWRHVDDGEMIDLVQQFPSHVIGSQAYIQLLANYVQLRKFKPLLALYAAWNRMTHQQEIRARTLQSGIPPAVAEQLLAICEAATAPSAMVAA